jgi:hypothetical protein
VFNEIPVRADQLFDEILFFDSIFGEILLFDLIFVVDLACGLVSTVLWFRCGS